MKTAHARIEMKLSSATQGFRVRGSGFSDAGVAHRFSRLALLLATSALLTAFGSIGCALPDYGARVSARLERVAFNNPEAASELGKALAEMKAAELTALCDMLLEPGRGDDTKARMALHGLAWYVGSEGTDEQRGRFVGALCKAIEADKPSPVKAFLIRQLQLAGDRRAVPTLAVLLSDEELCEPAVQALLAIGGEEGASALRQAIRTAEGQQRVALINGLGRLRDEQARSVLRREAVSDDKEVRASAISALALIGDPALPGLVDMLEFSGQHPESAYGRSHVEAAYLRAAEYAAARRQMGTAELFGRVDTRATRQGFAHLRCAVLHSIAAAHGSEAVGHIVEALTDDNPEFRAAATNIAVTLPGAEVTAAFVNELETDSATHRAGILTVLRRRGDEAALPAALAALSDDDRDVRIAAVKTAAALGREKAIGPLVTFLDTGAGDERTVAEQALTEMAGETVSRRLAEKLAGSSARVRAALLDVLARRGAQSQLKAVFVFLTDEDERVQIAAINAVGGLADQTAAPALVALLKKTEAEPVREAIEAALAATCSRAESVSTRAAAIVGAIEREKARDYCSLLRVLGRIGGARALETVWRAARDRRSDVKEAAIRAFFDWPDATAAADVLEIAREAQETKHHVLALRAYARLVGLDADRPAEKTLKLFVEGMETARRADEKKLILSELAKVSDPQTLDVLEGYLGDETLRAEAAAAMISVADGLLPGGWAPARDALEKVLETVEAESVRARAEKVLGRIAEYEDFITDWLVAGPYLVKGKAGHEVFDVEFAPEQPDAKDVKWKAQPASENPASYWRIDLNTSVGGPHRAAYLRTHVWSPGAQEALLELGSDDGIKVWLNGEVIHANNALRGCAQGQDKLRTTLNAGWNQLLIKVTQDGGAWAACVRVRAPDGGRLRGCKIDSKAQP